MIDRYLLFPFIFQKKTGQLSLWRCHFAQGNAEIFFGDLPIPDFIVDDPQGFRIFGGNDNAACVAVDPVAQSRRKGIFPTGIPLPLLVEVGLDVVDKRIDLFRLVGMDHKTGPLIQKEEVFILVEDVQLRLEKGEKEVVLPGLVEKLIVDIEL